MGVTGPPPIRVSPFISWISAWQLLSVLEQDVGMAVAR
jgi:hypothetical protein